MKYLRNLSFACVFLSLLIGCSKGSKKSQEETFKPVVVGIVSRRTLTEQFEFAGTIEGETQAIVYPKVAGTVSVLKALEGKNVKKDEPIIMVDRDEVGYTYQSYPILSPINGVVGSIYVHVGERVEVNTRVALIANIGRVHIPIEVPEIWVSLIKNGMSAELIADGTNSHAFQGKILRVSGALDPITRTGEATVQFENPNQILKPGMFGRVRVTYRTHPNVIAIPEESILFEREGAFVFKVDENVARKKKISLGVEDHDWFQVLSGLNENDSIVLKGHHMIRDGETVKIITE